MNEKLIKEANRKALQYITRRHFLLDCVAGMGSIALGSLLAGCGNSLAGTDAGAPAINPSNPMAPKTPHFAPRAKSVIYLHMAGAPSQLELFDHNTELHQLHNQPCPPSQLEGNTFAFILGVPKMLGPKSIFKRFGESGAWVSAHRPHFSIVVDELSCLKAVHTDQ